MQYSLKNLIKKLYVCYTQSDVLFTFLENIHKEDHNLHFPRNKTNKRHANRTKLQRQQGCRIVISFIMNCKTLCLPVQIEFLEQWNVHKIGRRTITFYGLKYFNHFRIGIVNSRWKNENLTIIQWKLMRVKKKNKRVNDPSLYAETQQGNAESHFDDFGCRKVD